jgi:hypothetical protein
MSRSLDCAPSWDGRPQRPSRQCEGRQRGCCGVDRCLQPTPRGRKGSRGTTRAECKEFDRELPALARAGEPGMVMPEQMLRMASQAKSAATSLRALAGYVEGLIEAVVLDPQITMERVQAAREAARQPPGFR